jgi:SAM-dependent methyltransferase/uncharacterized protein YbaR (Trm112 family)
MQDKKIQIIKEVISCPDCKASLDYKAPAFVCSKCNRSFPVHNDSIIEMLPSHPSSFAFDEKSAYHEKIYHTLFNMQKEQADPEKSWAPPEQVPDNWRKVKMGHVEFVKELLLNSTSSRRIFCDFTGGSGYYTFELYKLFDWVFHCDLSIESMLYASNKAKKENIENMIFVRTDYFKPPFNNSIDAGFCGDTLIYSPPHEGKLLNGIRQALKEGAVAVIDFHNWWHNPLRRMGLMKNTFGECYSYSKKQTDSMVTYHFPKHTYKGYYQEFEKGKKPTFMPSFFPNTRHTYLVQKTKALYI